MTVFNTYLKILKKNIFIIILYTAILLIFGISNMSNSESNMNFTANKPNIIIINNDEDNILTNNMVKYLENNCNIVKLDDDNLDDALFYRRVNYIIYIDKNYGRDFIEGKNPTIEVKSSGDYNASLAEMMLKRYVKIANIYQKYDYNEVELISIINKTLDKETKVEINTKLDSTALDKAAYYFSFESYSILACLIYIICLVVSIFNSEKIRKRTIISSMNYKKFNRLLLLSNCLFSVIIWLFYLIVGVILIGHVMLTIHGLLFIINSLLFTICSTTLAFLLSNLLSKKESITGIMNVVALGSSFLCGAFVPQEFLPSFVLTIAHILPTYYYIGSNDIIKSLEIININTLKPVLINMLIILVFSLIFIIINNFITNKKRKIG